MSESHCRACGVYMPKTLEGSKRVHDCDRTPPLDGLPTTLCACPVCGGHGANRWGCWGTTDRPHEHAFMRPVHELVREYPVTNDRPREHELNLMNERTP